MDAFEERFQREKVCYEQNFQHARLLNQILWQVPMIAVTLTGGLWFAAASMKGVDAQVRSALLGFATVIDLTLIFMIIRVRDVLSAYLGKLREFLPAGFADTPDYKFFGDFRLGHRGVERSFVFLMFVAAGASCAGAIFFWIGTWSITC